MKTAAIICEYNPFHYGHKFHMDETRAVLGEDTRIVCLMSGDFVQRGEAAYKDKWYRAKVAVDQGADLVIELPFCYACNGAKQFAEGAVKILEKMGCIDCLSFGSESGSLEELEEHVEISGDAINLVKEGVSYAVAMGKDDVLKVPNNTLGIEYLRALRKYSSDIKPMTIKRGEQKSSSYIRSEAREGKDISPYTPAAYEGYTEGLPYELIASAIFSKSAEELDSLPSAGEGIGFKLKSEVRKHSRTESLVDAVRQTRYTKARIKRVLCQMLVGYEESDAIRVLAASENGTKLIREMKKEDIDVITNINKEQGVADADIHASDIYNLITSGDLYAESDFVKKPYIRR